MINHVYNKIDQRKRRVEEMTESEPYESLRKVLNLYPLKTPLSKKFIKLLKMLYTEEEAIIVSKFGLPYISYMSISRAAKKFGKSEEDIEKIFNKMAEKGTLFFEFNKKGEKLYCVPPFIPGIYEFYAMSKNDPSERKKEILKILEEYYFETFAPETFNSHGYPYFRILPNNDPVVKTLEINEEVPTGTQILPFEVANSYIRSANYIAVGDCPCRVHAEEQDGKKRCNKPINVCLVFDNVARYWADKGIGRLLSHEEADAVLHEAAQAGLVHVTTNNQEFDVNMGGMICNCCSCCCFILQGLLKTRGKGGLAKSNFQPEFLMDKCTLCLRCVNLCPVNAIFHHQPHTKDLSDNYLKLDQDLCIGCGVCASVCKSDAVILKKINDEIPEKTSVESSKRYNEEKLH